MRYVIFGESHGPAIGVVLEGVPAGLELDLERVSAEMARRAPGGSPLSTARKEADVPEILSGLFEGRTTGTPLCAVIANTDTRSRDYAKLKDLPRPGHGDYAGYVRYQGCNDYRGGGHFSGRLTAPLVFAGAVAKQLLEQKGVQVAARISNVAGIPDPTPEQYEQAVLEARSQLDSVGGCIRCAVTGLPAGLRGERGGHLLPAPLRGARGEGGGLRRRSGLCLPAGEPGQRQLLYGWRHSEDPDQPLRRGERGHHQRDAGGVRGMHPAHPLHRPASADGGSGPAKRRGADHHRPARPLYPASGAARDRGRRRPGCLPADGPMTDLDRERDAI